MTTKEPRASSIIRILTLIAIALCVLLITQTANNIPSILGVVAIVILASVFEVRRYGK